MISRDIQIAEDNDKEFPIWSNKTFGQPE